MSMILQVAQMPNEIAREEAIRRFGFCCAHDPEHSVGGSGCSAIHVSVLRNDQVLRLVLVWLREGVPASVVLELVAHIEELAKEYEAKGKR